ncbi:MAG: lactonase family protein [Nitrospirales bacterium]
MNNRILMAFLQRTVFIIVVLGIPCQGYAAEYLYLASGDTIAVKAIDQQTGTLRDHQIVNLDGAGPMTFSPDHTFLYIVAKLPGSQKPFSIATYRIEDDAKLTLVHNAPIPMRTTYLQTNAKGDFLIGNHYKYGKMSVWKLSKGVYEGEIVQEILLEKQTHSAVFSQDSRYILVPATGPNKVFQITFDANSGKVALNTPTFASGPTIGAREPRHLVFNRQLDIAYTTQERMHPGVATWTWDSEKGLLKLTQNIVTTKENVKSISTADLHITPNNQFLYISSRDDEHQRDSIIFFKIDPKDGHLSLINHFPSEHFPRSFCISKSGKFLYVAGQGDARLGVYKIHPDTGYLKKITQYQTGARPTWVTTLVR